MRHLATCAPPPRLGRRVLNSLAVSEYLKTPIEFVRASEELELSARGSGLYTSTWRSGGSSNARGATHVLTLSGVHCSLPPLDTKHSAASGAAALAARISAEAREENT